MAFDPGSIITQEHLPDGSYRFRYNSKPERSALIVSNAGCIGTCIKLDSEHSGSALTDVTDEAEKTWRLTNVEATGMPLVCDFGHLIVSITFTSDDDTTTLVNLRLNDGGIRPPSDSDTVSISAYRWLDLHLELLNTALVRGSMLLTGDMVSNACRTAATAFHDLAGLLCSNEVQARGPKI